MFKKIISFILLITFLQLNISYAAIDSAAESKYPDYANAFLGKDKYEKFNRKMFRLNGALNKFIIKPMHIAWASIMPKYGMDRLQGICNNLDFTKRFTSCLIQKDFKALKNETLRFVTNTTLGLGGMFDPAKKFFKLEPKEEDMEQALAKCNVKQGSYLVMPVISSTTPRHLAGKLLECPLDPSVYLAGPITAAIKFALLVNKTAYMQPLLKMLESTYADPYDIAKKLYGIENYIKNNNLDRINIEDDYFVQNTQEKPMEETVFNVLDVKAQANLENIEPEIEEIEIKAQENVNISEPTKNKGFQLEQIVFDDKLHDNLEGKILLKTPDFEKISLRPDIILKNFKPQSPVVDSMRTALFELPGINNSIWAEISLWNRSFAKRIKTGYISVDKTRDDYKFRYIMQKDKNSPVAIIYPSIGEGVENHHGIVLAKMFYDCGYSVIIQGSHFHFAFVKSMPKGYHPGVPERDIYYLQKVTSEIISFLSKKYKCNFKKKVVLGTSFGAFATLFLANEQAKNNTLNISQYISVNPPIELMFALQQLDKNNDEWKNSKEDFEKKTAYTAAKIIKLAKMQKEGKKIQTLPFSDSEGKIITSFVLRQKLSDLIYAIEEENPAKKSDFYEKINNTKFKDYTEDYILSRHKMTQAELNYKTSLYSISDFLKKHNNYVIYHTLNDYFADKNQLAKLKLYCGKKLILLDNGAHLGFLYRKEFQDSLLSQIKLSKK